MMIPRTFLAVVGLLYLALALWCSFAPAHVSEKVGFTLNGDSGRSEFLTVYGGLEFAIAMIFLFPLLHADSTEFSLGSCVLIHGSLVLFRSFSLLKYRDFSAMTGKLAAGEWVILLSAIAVWVTSHRPTME